MQNKNAKDRLQDTYTQLQSCKDNLNQAIQSVEKNQNKVQLQSTVSAIDNAISTANRTLSNYQE